MKFLDEARIFCASGSGGDGCVSFRREKYIEFGGPDGGNGGKGGSVIFRGVENLNTLIDFRYTQHYKARKGGNGSGRNRTGRGADDVIIDVPLGTEIIDDATGELLMDITQQGQQIVLLEGGRGGRGNLSFTTSVNRAPRQFTKGKEGAEMDVRLRLKLIADVGLLGFPNAGKSTFISSVSNAKPKVADYPFTTLHPNLGMVRHHAVDMVLADLPGLIEGAHEGTGLGHRFLKHLSRCGAQLHLIDGTEEDPVAAYRTIRTELEKHEEMYHMGLLDVPEVVALTKKDAMDADDAAAKKADLEKASGKEVFVISAVAHDGIDGLLDALSPHVKAAHEARHARAQEIEAEGFDDEEVAPAFDAS